MKKDPIFWGIFASPPRWGRYLFGALPFLLLIAVYLIAAHVRNQANPDDKLLPTLGKMADAVYRFACTPDERTGSYLLWADTWASLKRIGCGVFMSASVGLLLGLNLGMLPGLRALGLPFLTFVSNIPILSTLPILFIVFGIDETAKVMLIFLGTYTMITRDLSLTVQGVPREQVIKALTLGASQFGVVYRIILPQIMPRLIENIRLSLGPAWLFLLASEMIAATEGLGYRIFLVRRYLSMDVIIPYVLWITFLAYTLDILLRTWVSVRYRWYAVKE
jgi:NitT/TauT family transport system permease protein